MTAARKRVLRPDLVVLSTGFVPAAETEHIAQTLGVERDEDGFIEILDRKNRATETSGRGHLRLRLGGRPQGPHRGQHGGLGGGQRDPQLPDLAPAGAARRPRVVDAAQCVGCDTCMTLCPFGAITLEERPADAPRPAEVKDDGKLAVIDRRRCRACGICAANCPEVAIAHNLSDDALFGRIAPMIEGAEKPVVGFYCRECAGAAIGLSGQRRDRYPESRAPHRAALPGTAQRHAHRRGGPTGRSRGVPGRLRRRPLPVPHRRHQRAGADRRSPRSCWPRRADRSRSSSGTCAPSTA